MQFSNDTLFINHFIANVMTNDGVFAAIIMSVVTLLVLVLRIPTYRKKCHSVVAIIESWWWILTVLFICFFLGTEATNFLFLVVCLRAIFEVLRLWSRSSSRLHHNKKLSLIQKFNINHLDIMMLFSVALFFGSVVYLQSITAPQSHRGILLFVIFASQFNDVAQYLSGKAFGHKLFGERKLAVNISPNKTIEGALIGPFIMATFCISIGQLLTPFSVLQCFVAAVLIGVAGILGDLLESAFKRHHKVKDVGTFIKGHGGVLDRIDSLLLSLPLFTLFYVLFYVLFLA